MRKRTWIIGGAMVLALATNFPPLSLLPTLLRVEPIIHVYHYQGSNGVFEDEEVPEKGRSLGCVQADFRKYQADSHEYQARNDQAGLILYRRFRRQWWRFWDWYDYFTNAR